MSTKPQHYCLQWNNYTTHITDLFLELLDTNCLVDVTLCVEHRTISAHRIILSACSTFFQDIFSSADDQHPIVILGEMKYENVKSVIEFIYRGELSVSADQVSSVLQVARELKVRGLMEVSGQVLDIEETACASSYTQEEESELAADDAVDAEQLDSQPAEREVEIASDTINYFKTSEQPLEVNKVPLELELNEDQAFIERREEEKQNKNRRDIVKRTYSDVVMSEALAEIRSGRSLQEISESHKIPRSTLYFRARSQGVPVSCPRQEHSQEKVNAALVAISGGCSLQQAAKQYKIPKTVLWRRIQKEGEEYVSILRSRNKPRHNPVKKQAAIEALENGANLSKVSSQFMIPKTTLFREKSRLVQAGRLPLSSLRKRNQSGDGFRQQRLAEAVAACKGGKMSQAAASSAYKVSKSTIWRRLRSGKDKVAEVKYATKEPVEQKTESIEEIQETKLDDIVVQLSPDADFAVVTDNNVVTYMEESDFSDASLIILTSGDSGDTVSLPIHENQVIVDSDGNQILES